MHASVKVQIHRCLCAKKLTSVAIFAVFTLLLNIPSVYSEFSVCYKIVFN